MDDTPDPIHNFFSAPAASQPDILYFALQVTRSSTLEAIKKSYRKLALQFHPDKHASKSEQEKEDMSKEFQRIGFAYAVLSDEGRRKRYDKTGRTDESAFSDAEAMGWDAYFETLFQRVDRKMLDDDKQKYQGSEEEKQDLIEAYNSSKGSLPSILSNIPHSSNADESRFISIINDSISSGTLESTNKWVKSSTDKTASLARSKAASKEAKEAEKAAKELGVWDEFYGSGQKGKRQGGEKGEKDSKGGKDSGEGGLQALILKRQRERESGLDALAEKYRKIEEEQKAKKGKKGGKKVDLEDQENGGPPDISDADFEALQAKMFGSKEKAAKGKKGKA